MPYARRTRPRTYRRRSYFSRYRKGSRYYKKKSTKRFFRRVTRLGTPFPRFAYQKLRYAETFNATVSGVSGAYTFSFRPTDIRDPNYSGVGGSYTGFAEMLNIYKKWSVRGYKISAQLTNTSNYPVIAGITNTGENFAQPASGSTVQQELLENNNGKYVLLAPAGGSGNTKTIRMYVRPKTIVGDTFKDADYSGSGNSDPSKWIYSNLLIGNQDRSTNASTVTVVIRVTSYVKWSERIFAAVD